MKRIKISTTILFLVLGSLCNKAIARQDSVTISGKVTDFQGVPIDSCSVIWQSVSFNDIAEAITDRSGFYSIRIPKGKYQSMAAIYIPSYEHEAEKVDLPDSLRRLEFWAWNFIADRDTTVDIRYHRMEAYGMRVFSIPGAVPAYQIYVRPMSLTRFHQWMETKKQKAQHGEDLSNGTLMPLQANAESQKLAPPLSKLQIRVWVDGEEVNILHRQEIDEYVNAREKMNAYLVTVGRPRHSSGLPYRVFRIELKDLENGDTGEGLYYLEKEYYIR
ncbi:carboxypeptidase-like regulatory domain-containing protein [Prevotella sp. KH2C16]|uniref:carboxypeptidase-like regulatory domain-containing protein n=1 Tax=Prevotella sp. KH2C16 TaxID=1855325 RepID=UPI0008E02D45|nr:carboxypeptidase-like regulatory domain-containing protein [Prevotella sp. KH2C16]SFG26582.1 hypothetical protein SAMN05216383_10880 [Prevotella sp. KH2C16]